MLSIVPRSSEQKCVEKLNYRRPITITIREMHRRRRAIIETHFDEHAKSSEGDLNVLIGNSCDQVVFLVFCFGLVVGQHNQPYPVTTPVPILKQINK